jgi:hypothetical protein
MAVFRTIVPLPNSFPDLNHEHCLLAVGSCFTLEIGNRLKTSKFNIQINPSGILYNPLSIAKLLDRIHQKQYYEEGNLFQHQGLWHSYDHHSRFSKPDKVNTLQLINEELQKAFEFYQTGTHLLLTLGTAHVYTLPSTDEVVANCHKMPAKHFVKKLLSVEAIVSALGNILKQWKQAKPALKIILTVSPVKHLRDGLIDNNLSKATLLLACRQLCSQLSDVYYFPSYEILTEELRDYRFYASDMAHPSNMAVEYIWNRFTDIAFKESTKNLVKKIEKITAAVQHRPFNPESSNHQQFIHQQLNLIDQLKMEYPQMDWSAEKEQLNAFKID